MILWGTTILENTHIISTPTSTENEKNTCFNGPKRNQKVERLRLLLTKSTTEFEYHGKVLEMKLGIQRLRIPSSLQLNQF
jgi:hypothetical protein